MTRGAAALCALAVLAASGGVVAGALTDVPQDAQSAQDVTAELNRQAAEAAREEAAPQAEPAPARPTPLPAPDAASLAIPVEPLEPETLEVAEATPSSTEAVQQPVTPTRRQRKRVAVIEAVDKVTAERMRFEVEVGGRPVRFQKALIFTAKACEVSTPDETVQDSIAYIEIGVQPRAAIQTGQARQIFRGWMFASSPGVSGLQHRTYDAWVVGCRA